ncbi:hypothetical protein BH10PSE19_BH10PSE19_08220 [soil metagenome]
MQNMTQILDWDTNVFGYKVARILPACLTHVELEQAIDYLKTQDVKLIFWASDSADQPSQLAAQQCHGFLADRKTTYWRQLDNITISPNNHIPQLYQQLEPSGDLITLALESGNYSRFQNDPRIGRALFEKIYTLWITNSTNGQIADGVLVTADQQTLTGMVTLGEKNNRGDIGLLAVAENQRGAGLGVSLVQAALQAFQQKGYSIAQVVTQQDNLPACRLYEKCGFSVEKVENFYHFWLTK